MCQKLSLLICLTLLVSSAHPQNKQPADYDWDTKLKSIGLVDVCFWEPSIHYNLIYATPNNFLKKPLYNAKLTKAWLHPRAAKMLIHAQEYLQMEQPGLSLLVYDAARPMEVQRAMWEWGKRTNKDYYFADPAKGGGLHNYGMAVDVTLVNEKNEKLPMGTPFDFFGAESHTNKENDLLKQRRITPAEYQNRKLLRRVMESAGFTPVASEWWHFNACTRDEALKKYKLIDR